MGRWGSERARFRARPGARLGGSDADRGRSSPTDACSSVLDSCERLLATSRERLRAESESVHRLSPLEVPHVSAEPTAAEASTFSAVELFVERAAACVDGFVRSDAEAPLVAEICRRLDGTVLAIELVARRVGAFGVGGVAARLDDRFRLLTSGRRMALRRHQTLSAALDWSYEFLPRNGTRDAAPSLRSSPEASPSRWRARRPWTPRSAPEIVDGVASLVAKLLIAAHVSGAAGIYRLLDTTRAYALEKLAESGEHERIARRHAEHCLALLKRASAEWLASYGRQIDNVRLALDWAFSPAEDASIGVRLSVAAIPLRAIGSFSFERASLGADRGKGSQLQYHRCIQSNVGEYGAEVEAVNAADGRRKDSDRVGRRR